MKRMLGRRPSPAMIIAIIALIAALGGTALAGGGFLTTKQFKKQAVRGPVQYVTASVNVPNNPNPLPEATANCPSGTKVLGGGAEVPSSDGSLFFDDSHPVGTTGWRAKFDNASGGAAYTGVVTADRKSVGEGR